MNIKTGFLVALLAMGTTVTACNNSSETASEAVFTQEGTAETVAATAATSDWEPKKPIEFVIMAGKGGGADKMARLMQTIVQKHNLASKPLVPLNKGGGSGAEALQYLKSKEGDNYTIMVTLNSFYTTPLRQPNLNVDISTFTPIARMAEDTFLLWVNKDSGITNFDEFVAAAKEADKEWLMAGTGKGQEDEILTNFLNSNYDLDMTYIPLKGGGDVAKQLAGKQVNSTVNNPSEALGFYEEGSFVPVASFTANRLEQFPDTPTFEEMGQDFSYFMQRSVVGAPGMSPEAQAYYQNVFEQVYQTPEWQEYMKSKSLKGEFITGSNLESYWMNQEEKHKELLKNTGEIK
ncbi:MAG: tripartite tricarboxylate transporter substrate binding protein [Xenococcaceae cyanobacterium MO_167.B27]|nr:tripartite tricarboxylate transporter substrate binding protein [Xenococcaceae cyanobacterium MO_167.B27]